MKNMVVDIATKAGKMLSQNKGISYGRALMNSLYEVNPYLYSKVSGTECDPSHDDNNVEKFFGFIMENKEEVFVKYPEVESLKGKTFIKIDKTYDDMFMVTDNGEVYRFYHEQDCCEDVTIESITGDLDRLLNHPLLLSEVVVSNNEGDCSESCTWTFYKFATIRGYVDIRWFGQSNGYYSEEVTLERIR